MDDKNHYFLDDQTLSTVIKDLNPIIKKYNRGEILFKQTTEKNRFCILLSGVAYLEVANEYDTKQILEYFIKGQILCPDMIIRPRNGNCYIIAKYPCAIAYIDPFKEEKNRQSRQNGCLDYLPAFIFRSSLYFTQQHCHILQQKTIRSKLLTFLYCQAERQNSFSVYLPIPYSDLADYLAVDRSTLMKEISRLCTEGLIEKKSRQITLLSTNLYS